MTRPTRRSGLLVAALLTPIALGGIPGALRLVDRQLSVAGAAWASPEAGDPQVARGTSLKISGTTRKLLRPGFQSRINLMFANRSPGPVTLRHVSVTITGITAPQADAQHQCTRVDFRIRPMRAVRLELPAHRSTDLLRLGVRSWRWPALKLRNRPVNQDGCKGARLTLRYRGYRDWSG